MLNTHLSEICKFMSMSLVTDVRNLFYQSKDFSLHNIPSFKEKKKSYVKKSGSIPKFDFIDTEKFKTVFKEHIFYNHGIYSQNLADVCSQSNHCRFLFLCLTGVRFENSTDLKTNSILKPKTCQTCRFSSNPCSFPTAACFQKIVFFETKVVNVSHECIFLPYLQNCYNHLRSLDSNLKVYKASLNPQFNLFLKEKVQSSSQKCRKFLPNLVDTKSSNTGSWKSTQVMKTHYLNPDNKMFLAHNLINELLADWAS